MYSGDCFSCPNPSANDERKIKDPVMSCGGSATGDSADEDECKIEDPSGGWCGGGTREKSVVALPDGRWNEPLIRMGDRKRKARDAGGEALHCSAYVNHQSKSFSTEKSRSPNVQLFFVNCFFGICAVSHEKFIVA